VFEPWFAGTRLIDAVLLLTVVEGLALAAYHRATGRGIPSRDFALNLVSGLLLMLALRSVLAGAGWWWTAACLAVAGLAHGADLWMRWRR